MTPRPFRLTPPVVKLLEKDVIKACLDLLQYRGWWVRRNPVGKYQHAVTRNWAEFGPPGIPDYLALHERYPAFFIEFKRPKGKLRATQVSQFQVLRERYHLTAIKVDSLESLVEFLKDHERRARGP